MNNNKIMNPTICPHTLEDIQSCKDITLEEVRRDYQNLINFDALTNPKKFSGNPTLYFYQHRVLLNCKREGTKKKPGMTLKEIYDKPEEIQKLWDETTKRNRRDKDPLCSATDMFECYRINRGAIVFFKSSTAKYVYNLFNATSVLDPTAGWGGRMLGASSLGIRYTGFDTNINLKSGYDRMIEDLNLNNVEMIYEDCLKVDFSNLIYDLVLTSPPYINMELYEGMPPFESDYKFYNEFLIPLMDKCYKYLQPGGAMCFNISPTMFKKLCYRNPDCTIDLRQQLGKEFKTKSQDYIYVWKKPAVCV
tara:strand:- start:758 stop:1675 length:918 start_codon:yes stop_codon:yes gene_type:complete